MMVPPQDVPAEQAVLGSVLISPEALAAVDEVLVAEDFYQPRHQVIWDAVRKVAAEGVPVDALTVNDTLLKAGDLSRIGGTTYLHTLIEAVPVAASASYYAAIVLEKATLRRLVQGGTRIVQMAQDAATANTGITGTIEDLVERARLELSLVEHPLTGDAAAFTVRADVFIQGEDEQEPDWVVPGLFARQDRFMLTGSGGLGKTTLLRQIAVCAAAGIHPFDWCDVPPTRVMIIDCENSDDQNRQQLRPLLLQARMSGRPVEDRLTIGGHGNPIDLLQPAEARALLKAVEHDKPDLVYVGPVYKLHQGDPDKEAVIKTVTGVLDRIRATGAALMMEAHPNKTSHTGGSMAPSGANLWSWWPEFGRGLRMDPDSDAIVRRCVLEPWRIDRVRRDWPDVVDAGGRWPWARSRIAPAAAATWT